MSDQYTITYSPEAYDDLKSIYAYIAYTLQVEDVALNQVNRIRTTLRKLDKMPNKHPIVEWEPWKSMQMRRIVIGNYSAYYLVEDEKESKDISSKENQYDTSMSHD